MTVTFVVTLRHETKPRNFLILRFTIPFYEGHLPRIGETVTFDEQSYLTVDQVHHSLGPAISNDVVIKMVALAVPDPEPFRKQYFQGWSLVPIPKPGEN